MEQRSQLKTKRVNYVFSVSSNTPDVLSLVRKPGRNFLFIAFFAIL